MAEQETPCPEMKEGWMGLNDALSEMYTLERYVTQCNNLDIETGERQVNTEILLLLINGLREKIDYLTRKYGLNVPEEENVETVDLIEFVRERCPPFNSRGEIRCELLKLTQQIPDDKVDMVVQHVSKLLETNAEA